MKPIGKRVGLRIRVRRTELELSQWDLANALGLSQGQISHIENGARSVSLETLEAVARALQCEPADLLRDREAA